MFCFLCQDTLKKKKNMFFFGRWLFLGLFGFLESELIGLLCDLFYFMWLYEGWQSYHSCGVVSFSQCCCCLKQVFTKVVHPKHPAALTEKVQPPQKNAKETSPE